MQMAANSGAEPLAPFPGLLPSSVDVLHRVTWSDARTTTLLPWRVVFGSWEAEAPTAELSGHHGEQVPRSSRDRERLDLEDTNSSALVATALNPTDDGY